MNSSTVVTGVLVAAVFGTALSVIHAKHQSRKLFVELQKLQSQRDELTIEWGRLQLEQSTWAAHGRIETVARKQLHMFIPPAETIAVVAE